MYGITAPMSRYKNFEIIDMANGFNVHEVNLDQEAWFVTRDSERNIYCNFNFRVGFYDGIIPEVWTQDKPLDQAKKIIKDLIDTNQLYKTGTFKYSFHWTNYIKD